MYFHKSFPLLLLLRGSAGEHVSEYSGVLILKPIRIIAFFGLACVPGPDVVSYERPENVV